jgi:hypothetical protein
MNPLFECVKIGFEDAFDSADTPFFNFSAHDFSPKSGEAVIEVAVEARTQELSFIVEVNND